MDCYDELDLAWCKIDAANERIASLEHRLEQTEFLAQLWIQGLLGIMSPKQRAQSLAVCSRIIAEGFAKKGWDADDKVCEVLGTSQDSDLQLEQHVQPKTEGRS